MNLANNNKRDSGIMLDDTKYKFYLESTKTQRRMLDRAKSRAKRYGIEYNLDLSDITIPTVCPILGIFLEVGAGNASPSLDRVDSSKGYVKGNVQVISQRANLLKSDATLSEIEALLNYLKKYG